MIKSFRIDHINLEAGLYLQGVDHGVATYDLRMVKPYFGLGRMEPEAAHAIEHLLATTLREVSDEIVYVGPMGCMTGFYVLTDAGLPQEDFLAVLIESIERALRLDHVPGQAMESCGNYTYMDHAAARDILSQYLVLIKSRGFGQYAELK